MAESVIAASRDDDHSSYAFVKVADGTHPQRHTGETCVQAAARMAAEIEEVNQKRGVVTSEKIAVTTSRFA